MRSHCSFECLKFELWTKERLGVKLTIWFLIIQTQEIEVKCLWNRTCDIILWSSLQRLKVFFIIFSIQTHAKIINLQNWGIHNLAKLGMYVILSSPQTFLPFSWNPITNPNVYKRSRMVNFTNFVPWCVLWVELFIACFYTILVPNCNNCSFFWFVQIDFTLLLIANPSPSQSLNSFVFFLCEN